MGVNDESAEPGCFVATASIYTPAKAKRYYIFGWALIALFVTPFVAYTVLGRNSQTRMLDILPWICVGAFMVVCLLPFLEWAFRRKVRIAVTGDGLRVDRRRSDVYSYGDVQVGLWNNRMSGGTTVGTALHLRSGRHRFVIGGKDHRVATGTRLDAPAIEHVDATMSVPEFDELLAVVGHRGGGLDVRRPAPGQPTRCLLNPCPAWFFGDTVRGELASIAMPFRRPRLDPPPSLAIDVDDDAVSVIDPNTNTLIASARLPQVTATPAEHHMHKAGRLLVLVVDVPGLQERIGANRPLTITCREGSFSWTCRVPEEDEPSFVVSAADWVTLVEKLGLGPYLGRRERLSG